jgi:hypothetical protein
MRICQENKKVNTGRHRNVSDKVKSNGVISYTIKLRFTPKKTAMVLSMEWEEYEVLLLFLLI